MVRLVREGLQSIRDGLDHTPVAATRYYASFFEQWHEILVGAFAAYVSKRTIIVEGTISEFSEGIGSFMALWAHLNTEVDIEIQDLHSCVTRVNAELRDAMKAFAAEGGGDCGRLVCHLRARIMAQATLRRFWNSYGREWQVRVIGSTICDPSI